MPIRIRFSCYALKLQTHRRNLQPVCKRGNDVILLVFRTQHKVNRFNLKNFNIPAVRRFNDSSAEIFDRNKILRAFLLFLTHLSQSPY